MKKHGFTLAEALVTLLIIGVVVAMVLPVLVKSKPDEMRISYLKAYDTLSSTVKSLARNSQLYSHAYEFNDTDGNSRVANVSKYPLYNTKESIHRNYNNNKYSGDVKLCNLLASAMDGDSVNCKKTPINNDDNVSWTNSSFKTKNGMSWIIAPYEETQEPQQNGAGNWSMRFLNVAYVKIKPDGNDCLYNSTSCPNPNVYKFYINADGKVVPADAMGAYYKDTRNTWLKKDGNPDSSYSVDLDNLVSITDVSVTKTPDEECVSKGGHWLNGVCHICTSSQNWDDTQCKDNDVIPTNCSGEKVKDANGNCVCPFGMVEENGVCKEKGGGGETPEDKDKIPVYIKFEKSPNALFEPYYILTARTKIQSTVIQTEFNDGKNSISCTMSGNGDQHCSTQNAKLLNSTDIIAPEGNFYIYEYMGGKKKTSEKYYPVYQGIDNTPKIRILYKYGQDTSTHYNHYIDFNAEKSNILKNLKVDKITILLKDEDNLAKTPLTIYLEKKDNYHYQNIGGQQKINYNIQLDSITINGLKKENNNIDSHQEWGNLKLEEIH